ncbi:MAG TPA: hypothetical protein VM935_15765 [Chitinophagaceae bacterium]|nr:hypothetical protein [Chitinophagaceae bacterium]
MKNFSLIQMIGFLSLVVTMVSCGFSQPLYEDGQYSDRRSSTRIYDDPYYNNNSRTTIVRDPYTGQYYEVTPVGPGANYPGVYGNGYPARRGVYSDRTYNNRTYNRGNSTYNRGNSTYNRNTNSAPVRSQPQQPAPSNGSGNGGSSKINEARERMNGTAN